MSYLFHLLLKNKEDKGFTLIELLVTVLIIGILSALSLPNLLNQVQKAREAEAKNNLGAINRAQQAYRFEKGTFASSLDDINIDLTVGSYNGSFYQTKLYSYSVVSGSASASEVHHEAIPQPEWAAELKTVTSAINMSGGTITSLVCQGDVPGASPVITFSPRGCTDGELLR